MATKIEIMLTDTQKKAIKKHFGRNLKKYADIICQAVIINSAENTPAVFFTSKILRRRSGKVYPTELGYFLLGFSPVWRALGNK